MLYSAKIYIFDVILAGYSAFFIKITTFEKIAIMRNCIVGRKEEKAELDRIFNSHKAEFLAVCGRRRVGKTFLIKEYFEKELVFSVSGLAKANTQKQIKNFYSTLKLYDSSFSEKPADWLDAFNLLIKYLSCLPQEKKVILLDELPWMDTPRSGFISALEHFWNGWASSRRDIVLIVCGSATSWMMDNLINNHGGLHNRLTRQMFLEPFTLNETEQMLEFSGFNLSRYEIAEYYMILGGIPYYMTLLNPEESVAQNIDRLFFKRNGELNNEFDNLYAALFKNSESYIKIASILNSKRSGLTRNEIAEEAKLPSGGSLSKILKNMESCGFIRKYHCLSLGKTQTLFQLVDFFSLFYFRFIQHVTGNKTNYWSAIQGTQKFYSWAGLAFENLALFHIDKIKQALGISGIDSEEYTWRKDSNDTAGAQIDLLIDRKDNTINLCEIKFCESEYELAADEEMKLRNRISALRLSLKKKTKSIQLTMITSFGVAKGKHSGIIQSQVTLDDLFA